MSSHHSHHHGSKDDSQREEPHRVTKRKNVVDPEDEDEVKFEARKSSRPDDAPVRVSSSGHRDKNSKLDDQDEGESEAQKSSRTGQESTGDEDDEDAKHREVLEQHRKATLKNLKRGRRGPDENRSRSPSRRSGERRSRSRSSSPSSSDEDAPRRRGSRSSRIRHPEALQEERRKTYTSADVGLKETFQHDQDLPPTVRILEYVDKEGHPHFSYPALKDFQGTDSVDIPELSKDPELRKRQEEAKQARIDMSMRGGLNSHRTAPSANDSYVHPSGERSTGSSRTGGDRKGNFADPRGTLAQILAALTGGGRSSRSSSDADVPRIIIEHRFPGILPFPLDM